MRFRNIESHGITFQECATAFFPGVQVEGKKKYLVKNKGQVLFESEI
jgi:hypothetical protein